MERRRSNIRKELERYVVSTNKVLRTAIKTMSIAQLLRNAHPIYRPTFAQELLDAGEISKFLADEFPKTLKPLR